MLLLLAALLPTVLSQCSPGAVYYSASNRCLQLYRAKVEFDVAESICASSSGHLVSVQNAIDNNFIASRALQYLDGPDMFWLGAKAMGQDVTNPLNWAWNDGSNWSYNNWRSGQPVAQGDTSCLSMQVATTKWSTTNCSARQSFACSYPAQIGSTCPTPIIPSHCPSGYAYLRDTDSCYKYVAGYINFADARSSCVADGGDLASIHTQAENNFLVEFSKSGMNVPDKDWNNQVWIGFIYQDQQWHWTDGSAVTFVNWADGEPNNVKDNSYCTLVADPHQAKNSEYSHWHNVGNIDERAFLCKRAALH